MCMAGSTGAVKSQVSRLKSLQLHGVKMPNAYQYLQEVQDIPGHFILLKHLKFAEI